jgi:NAD(P)H-dependent FMN reductase
MKVLVLSGSRNPKGKTAEAINAILGGVTKAGGESECIFLPAYSIERCRQCAPDGNGRCRVDGQCVIEDDFAAIADKLNRSDVVVFASPVYFFDMSESLRAFLDRYRRVTFIARVVPSAQGFPAVKTKIPAVGLSYAGGSGLGTVECIASLDKALQLCGFDRIDMIPVRRQNLDIKKPALEDIGEWLVTVPTTGPMPPLEYGRK